jgi:hypothetical protein
MKNAVRFEQNEKVGCVFILEKHLTFLKIESGLSNKLKRIHGIGYKLFHHFVLPEDAWRINYFRPLEQLINKWKKKAQSNESQKLLESYQKEVNMFKNNPIENVLAFSIFQKIFPQRKTY